ncbi:Delta(9) fatty acid conjugase-like enzyme [Artemisia annua]|uniref:Delta(9) fatty acid conjugase-like enzyme n=1 Tax=Artemisia annua TaxID=35608 RepID=A0A2U1PFD8_ARTAN|nr:Delta(9) fatty acid conjugase-like enzyme [Artemisia annua]
MGGSDDMKVLERVPISKPPFEYNDLKKAIPPHCFTGTKLGGLWMLAYECGHHSLFTYHWLDDTVGFLLHSFVLTPYFSFKYSHRAHHAHTNSIEYDEPHLPKRRSDILYSEILDNPIGLVFTILFRLTLGYPSYLIFNYSGRKYDEGLASHLYPQSPIFKDSQRGQIFVSDVGVFVVLYAYYRVMMTQVPWFVMGAILMVLTFLQHNHPSIPHYDSTEWTWMRGALSAIDRDIGLMLVKSQTDYHVVHHLFPAIPRYHAREATEALKPI